MKTFDPGLPFEIRPPDLPETVALMREDLGASAVDAAFLAWWYWENPSGLRSLQAARVDGRLVGLATMNGFRLRTGEGPIPVGMPQNVVVEAASRGRGYFGTLYRASEARMKGQGVERFLTFTNEASTPIFLKKLGYLRGRVPCLRFLLSNPLDLLRPNTSLEVRDLDRGLFAGLGPSPVHGIVKDYGYYRWRYLTFRPEQYRVLSIRRADGGAEGYAFLKPTKKRGLPIVLLMDIVLAPGADPLAAVLAVRRRCLELGAAGLLMFVCGPEGEAAARLLGIRFANRFNFLVKGRDPTETAAWAEASFQFQLGDLDFT